MRSLSCNLKLRTDDTRHSTLVFGYFHTVIECARQKRAMNGFESDLAQRLAAIREQGLYRGLRQVDSPQSPRIQVEGKSLLNFSSNDYLGLANDPALKEAAVQGVARS